MALRTGLLTRNDALPADTSESSLVADALAPARGILIGVFLSAGLWAGGIWAAFHLL